MITADIIKLSRDGHTKLDAFLVDRIYEFNAEAAGFHTEKSLLALSGIRPERRCCGGNRRAGCVRSQEELMRRTWTIIGVGDVLVVSSGTNRCDGLPETAPAHDDFGQILDSDGTVLLCRSRVGHP